MNIANLRINSEIDNQTLCKIFGCAPQGGMRRSHKTNTLVLISDRTGIYEDRKQGEIFHYTGMGQKGDQELKTQNKTLEESGTTGIGVHFFEVMKKAQYTYRGQVELASNPYIGRQKDVDGSMRNVWIFPLKKIGAAEDDVNWLERIKKLENLLKQDGLVTDTEKERMVKIRIGQSKFKQKLVLRECKCALCGVIDANLLIGSHIKPWRDATNEERLDVNNGLLLCPNHDSVFDKGYITFDENGQLIVSNQLDEITKMFMNVNPKFKLHVTDNMKGYLQWHFENIFI